MRLGQVFSNLLINAAKYTDPGGQIQIRAAQQGQDVVIAVRDKGMGISPGLMPGIFDLYTEGRTTTGLQQSEEGLGIGLSLVLGLAWLHGGTVEPHSERPGCGSELIVRLPAPSEAANGV